VKAVAITPAYSAEHPLLRVQVERAGLPWQVLREHSDLVRVRSILLTQALATGAERIVLLDADTIPADGALEQLVASDLVTSDQALFGLYPQREGHRWQVAVKDPSVAGGAVEAGEPFEVEWGGLGFCVIHRESLARLSRQLPTIEGDCVMWQPWCLPLVRGSVYLAEDRAFCLRLAEAGTRLLCNPKLRAAHAVTRLIAGLSPRA